MLKVPLFCIALTLIGCREQSTTSQETRIELQAANIEWNIGDSEPNFQLTGTLKNCGQKREAGKIRIQMKMDTSKTSPSYFSSALKPYAPAQEAEIIEELESALADSPSDIVKVIKMVIEENLHHKRPNMIIDVEVPEGREQFYEFSVYTSVDLRPGENLKFTQNIHVPGFASFRCNSGKVLSISPSKK